MFSSVYSIYFAPGDGCLHKPTTITVLNALGNQFDSLVNGQSSDMPVISPDITWCHIDHCGNGKEGFIRELTQLSTALKEVHLFVTDITCQGDLVFWQFGDYAETDNCKFMFSGNVAAFIKDGMITHYLTGIRDSEMKRFLECTRPNNDEL